MHLENHKCRNKKWNWLLTADKISIVKEQTLINKFNIGIDHWILFVFVEYIEII